MECTLEQSGAVGVLKIAGDLTVITSGALKSALMNSLEKVDHLVLDLEGVGEVDLSCLQLLCSAHRTSARLNKQLTVANSRPEAFRQAVAAAGYGRHIGCSFDTYRNCIWLGGNG
ncbi:MAG: STAS domain-containing protein [Nitrospirota bacterium]